MPCFRFSRLACVLMVLSAALMVAPSASFAAALEWTNASGDNNWNTNGSLNFRDGMTNGVAFQTNDSVLFQDLTGATVNIDAAGVAPSSVTVNRGYGMVTTFNGGDILSGSLNFTRDDTNVFTRDASYSFGGGTFLSAPGGNPPTVIYQPTTAGAYQFGTGAISASAGQFIFNPAAPSTLSNNVILNGGTVGRNANATFTGALTINGNNFRAPAYSLFAFDTLPAFTQNMTMNITRGYDAAPIQFASNISGAAFDFTIANFGNPDWTGKLGSSTNNWNVKNVIKEGPSQTQFTGDTSKYFNGTAANGGAFILRGGSASFDSNVFNVDFTLLFDPNPAYVGTGTQTGAGFHNVSTVNINAQGVLGGDGTVASDNNLNAAGGIGDFESAVDVVVNGGTIAPGMGSTPGTLSVSGGVAFNASSTLRIDIGDVLGNPESDLLAVVGNVTGLNNVDLIVNLAGLTPSDVSGETFTILTAGNDLSSFSFNSITFENTPLNTYDVTYGNGFVQLSNLSVAVPEPSSLMLMGSLLIGAVGYRRRRNK